MYNNNIKKELNIMNNNTIFRGILFLLYFSVIFMLNSKTLYAQSQFIQFEKGSCIFDDFDFNIHENQNDFFADRGIWNNDSAVISYSFDIISGRNCALRLDYDVSKNTAACGWWEQFAYNYSEPSNPIYDISAFEEFHFSYKGGDIYTSEFIIEFVEAISWERKRFTISNVSDSWQEKVINIKDSLGGLDLSSMRQIAIVLDCDSITQDTGTLYFDNFYFVDKDESFSLELVSKKAFKFFWENSHPTSGLIRDKASNRYVSSIASIGFGLTALGIGAERAWVSRDEAANITRKILYTLYNTPQGPDISGCAGYNGFFYHLLNIATAERDGTSELSSTDTAILLAGILFVREYFDHSNTTEDSIRALADSIYNRVDWNWMLDTTRNQFRMAWIPETDSFDNWWNYYTDETILVCLLAIASGQVDSSVFYAWEREEGTYNDSTFIQTWWGSLFTYIFAECWINFQEVGTDSHPTTPVNWWENTRKAVLANRQFCIDSSTVYPTYSDSSWGLTACLGFNGYNGGISKSYGACPLGEPPTNHDGTVPPYGAGSSIIFFSSNSDNNEAVKALRNYYNNFPRLWGLYGFKDSYNIGTSSDSTDDWYADDFIGIDAGPTLLMIENYQDSLVWKYFMKNDKIEEALKKIFPDYPGILEEDCSPAKRFNLFQNSPNPFNKSTTIQFQIEKTCEIKLKIYNALGQEIETLIEGNKKAGKHEIEWTPKDLPTGIYLYRLETDENNIQKKMILLR